MMYVPVVLYGLQPGIYNVTVDRVWAINPLAPKASSNAIELMVLCCVVPSAPDR